MTKWSASLPPPISAFDLGVPGSATDPSSDATKFV